MEVVSSLHHAEVSHRERPESGSSENVSSLLIFVLVPFIPLIVCELVVIWIVRVKVGRENLLLLVQIHSVDDGEGDQVVAPLVDAFQGLPGQVGAVEQDNRPESMSEEVSQPSVSDRRFKEVELTEAGVLQVFENVSKGITDWESFLVTDSQELLAKLHREV